MAEGGSKLSEEEIYDCLKSLNVPVRMNDLKVPTREFIVRVFECFTKDLQIDVTSHTLRSWEATKHIEDPDIYEDSELLILLTMSVNHITNPCGLNISVKDVVEPKPKRTKKILNYLLVFWGYYLQKYARFRAKEETFESEKKKAESLLLENESLDEKYTEMVNILRTVQPSKEELLGTVASKAKRCEDLENQKVILMSAYQELKTKKTTLANQIGETDIKIVRAKERLEELRQLILSSPDRINSEIQNLKDRIKVESVKIKEKEKDVKDAEKRLEMQEESLKGEEKVMSSLDDVNEVIQSLRGTVKSIIINQENLNSEEDKVKKLQSDLERKRELKCQQDQIHAKKVLNARKQKESLMEVFEMLQRNEAKEKKNPEYIKHAVNDLQSKIDTESDKIIVISNKGKEAYLKTEERKKQFKSKMEEYRSIFQSDCDQIQEAIKKKFQN